MQQHGIVMKKSLGQNFLVEPQILQHMIDVAEIDKNTVVIEIGPGIGALTEFLAKNAKEVFAFEIDQRFIEILEETLVSYENVSLIHQDILQVNFSDERYRKLHQADRLVVVANLPYYITTPIIMHLLSSRLPFQSLVMMMQKEVAERMTAKVGTKAYSSLTVAIQLEMDSELAFVVPKSVFIPQPNVDSAVLKLSRRGKARVEVEDPEKFQALVQVSFKQRRKTLWNNLKNEFIQKGKLDEVQLQQVLEQSGINPQRRAETLSIEEYAELYYHLEDVLNKL
ncbi:16S rRNA (adenine(1518)-N(6)/adenine(1519)-N(6))-dimethyltransferase RsmA [Facklamia sp. DSM 111018]|uniref:Ribosomal RNA small subunit methyltransferase A n=1 Tax=Facklamia lactis TaxID=2749967 RepID=A0ABS0LQS3_9LACT|nr:16S rRNA (adenine(1518)-N(6)/adenine(1519)-N(6))-dimethyltransferase RsmA [Facklamia lactis]MBG9980679.1 16S rRNA (adenine(1518)-N(6)/adenine(1519)-N(6))-dimethyltransferase RsmA [Facklamia lactis]MBG9986493.1 16S rRNA (adenine(1518)-N(6)/adenine(1519)-N(6))-dimethyltransferase RsmA [Facklamia lactis]